VDQGDEPLVDQFRRFLPRQFVDWLGTYVMEGHLEKPWRNCRVIDVSTTGAGLELADAPEEAVEGRRIFLDVHLLGEIRISGPGRDHRQRVGIQFLGLSQDERTYLESLADLEALW
jgi:PilZ domain